MKATASFKLSKQSKIHAENQVDRHRRGEFLRIFTQAEIAATQQRPSRKEK